jgi:hypothetical protein
MMQQRADVGWMERSVSAVLAMLGTTTPRRTQAILGFNLPCAAVAAHLAALHKLTQSEGGQAVVGTPAAWSSRVKEACEDVLGRAMDARGNMVRDGADGCWAAQSRLQVMHRCLHGCIYRGHFLRVKWQLAIGRSIANRVG